MSKFLFISIKPEYASKIIDGVKTIELRKISPSVKPGDYILIYATKPVKAVIGFGKIKRIIECTPELMWHNHEALLGIERSFFDSYFADANKAVGIEISSICKFTIPIKLDAIKKIHPSFSPPQTYRYLSKFKALKTIIAIDGNKLNHVCV